MKATRLFIVRHGQTAWNTEKVFRGTIDVPLNDQGFAEAAAVAKALAAEPVTFIYSSPLSRAVQTAKPLADIKGIKINEHAGLTDLNFGVWQGHKLDEVKAEYAELFQTWVERPHDCKIPGAETLAQAQIRALDACREIASVHPGQTVMAVSHRVVCKLLVLGLLGLGPDKFWNVQQDTAAINLFVMTSDTAIAFRINDTCHLAELANGRVTADF